MTTLVAETDAADFCLTDGDCDADTSSAGRGRTCVRLYDGCFVGQCMCRSRYQSVLDSAGRCVDGNGRQFTMFRGPLYTRALRIGDSQLQGRNDEINAIVYCKWAIV